MGRAGGGGEVEPAVVCDPGYICDMSGVLEMSNRWKYMEWQRKKLKKKKRKEKVAPIYI